eukprot:gene8231-14168_t
MLYSLQQEVAFQKTKIEEKEKQLDDAAKENCKEIRTCNEKVAVVKEIMDRTFNRIENDIQACRAKVEQARATFDEDKKHLTKLIESQESCSKDLIKAVSNYEQGRVSIEEFNALKATLETLQSTVDMTKESVPSPVRQMIKDRSSEWDKEVLEMVEKYQETRGFLMELITLDLSHERDIVGMKYRLEKLEEFSNTSQKSSGEFLPTPSLPEIERLKSVHSEAPSLRKSFSKQEPIDADTYQLKFSKISSVMKRMKESVTEAKSIQ